jgi:enoyl-CoA hydratase/carnithine racemase
MADMGVRLERNGAIAEIVLARPERQNAIDSAMWRAIAGHCGELARDATVRVVIVRGEGGAFSAGADITEFAQVFADSVTAHDYNELVQDALGLVERLPMPTIAQIGGNCIGGGCALAVACDLRFAAADARLGITPARLGLAYSLGDVRRLAALVGPADAKDLLFSARLVAAEEALRLGLVDRVLTTAELAGAVQSYAEALCGLSGNTHRVIKSIFGMIGRGQGEEDQISRALRDGAVEHSDFIEGRSAFLAKRMPLFN